MCQRPGFGGVAGEAQRPRPVAQPGHREPDGRVAGAALHGQPGPDDPIGLVRSDPLGMGGDQHPGVQDHHQPFVTTTSTGSPAKVPPTT